ncbi:hypothetical protein G6F57_003290 [Rhizopus arrhizus]|uniref:Uncharacterized protein n=1 Tax=Rhizopus oryzae TaxID=64495 RepID=A0A9P6XBU0_RHIOR|nr:hypothetical protein G6F24_004643 [Rhizopus arrhizus]KAG1411541.1 hypothetical protein G6F58_008501 [Rhizopus delemar]KAG0781743.1 hypothetical protein G6F22_009428 [Rhizopus arrhizus]KAG0791774.1 hypothetical protein G6F21_004843 [Rhizopus arrhizus]KAG0812955.1 hypothetical protein G6F20_005948 [Rhizopus arrhizus]
MSRNVANAKDTESSAGSNSASDALSSATITNATSNSHKEPSVSDVSAAASSGTSNTVSAASPTSANSVLTALPSDAGTSSILPGNSSAQPSSLSSVASLSSSISSPPSGVSALPSAASSSPARPYAGQILPCTYRLFSDVDTSALNLEIDLEAAPQGVIPQGTNITTLPIATSADVSKTDAFIKHEGNLTFYEHSINFLISFSVKPGNYRVIFFDKSTNTKLVIPIEIRPAASPTSVGARATSPSVPGRPHPSGSIFAQGASYSIQVPSFLVALVGVAVTITLSL